MKLQKHFIRLSTLLFLSLIANTDAFSSCATGQIG